MVIATLITPLQSHAQNRSAFNTAAAIVGITAIIGSGVFEYNQYIEMLELNATEYYLSKYPSSKFSLSLVMQEGSAFRDLSNVSVLNFIIEDFDTNIADVSESRKLLSFFLSHGWANEYGIDFTKVIPKEWNKEEWTRFYLQYASLASGVEISHANAIPAFSQVSLTEFESFEGLKIRARIDRGTYSLFEPFINNLGYVSLGSNIVANEMGLNKILSDGRKVLFLPFNSGSEDDLYFVKQFNDDFKIVYNEGNMGIFLLETNDLVEMKREWLNRITNFFYF
jgi:hypothetical protein